MRDRTLLSMIFANLVAIVLTFAFEEDIISVLWLYWIQSVTFCLVTLFSIGRLKRFSTKGITPSMNDNSPAAKRTIMTMFLVFYGIFHGAYAIFIGVAFGLFIPHQPANGTFILIGAAIFFLHQIREVLFDKPKEDMPLLGDEFMRPFLRLIPMHLIIILGPWVFITGVITDGGNLSYFMVIAFQIIKTVVEVISYRHWRKKIENKHEKPDKQVYKIKLPVSKK